MLAVMAFTTTQAQTVAPMVAAKFDQTPPFNNSCPSGCVAGCGPVALAQILYFYKAPRAAVGMATYTDKGTATKVSLNDILFDWGNILAEYPQYGYSDDEAKAVADLVYACGAAMGVSYNDKTAVTNYANMLFGMQHNMHVSVDSRYLRRAFYSTAEWIEMLNQQLRDGHPVFYRGTWFGPGERSDHMFLIDGVNEDGEYHVNFGHSGSGDKFADINYLNQSGTNPGNRGVCYNASQVMVVNCFPTPDFNDYPAQACISEEPIILNKDTMLRSVTVNRGETFSLSCRLRNCSNEPANIRYGWALVKDGVFINILSQRSYGLSPGYTFTAVRHLDVKLPVSMDDGDYTLQLFSKLESEENWREVWACAPTTVDVRVKNGKATVTVPDNHLGDPRLYLREDIREVTNTFENKVPGRTFELQVANETTNNFENLIKLEIVADGVKYSYEITQPVFSQTRPVLHILVPTTAANLKGRKISSVKVFYYHAIEERYIEMGETYTDVASIARDGGDNGDVRVYSTNGTLLKTVKADKVSTRYQEALESLPRGIYLVKEGMTTRKIKL